MTVEENLRVIDSGIDALNAHDWGRFVRLHAESVIDLNPAAPDPIKGHAALREYYEQFNRAFPDLRTQKDRSFGQGDWVCLETTSSGRTWDRSSVPADKRSLRQANPSA